MLLGIVSVGNDGLDDISSLGHLAGHLLGHLLCSRGSLALYRAGGLGLDGLWLGNTIDAYKLRFENC